MSASELYRAGKLREAIDAQTQEVKANPGDPNRRLFLFELLAFAGDLDRARRQIEAVKYEDVELEVAVQGYRRIVDAEVARRRVFAEGIAPKFSATAPGHLKQRLEAVQCLRSSRPAEAVALLQEANAGAADLQGTLNDKAITGLRDCDDLFGQTIEVFSHGEYYWIGLEELESLTAIAPRFPRDLLWLPARMELKDGPSGDIFIPTLYPQSHTHADPQVQLGRATDWSQKDGGPVLGQGLRTLLAGDDDLVVPALRELRVN